MAQTPKLGAMMQDIGLMHNKNILLFVTGSIAAYKALELASTLKKMGACVRVVMSEEAKKFIAPLSFEAILHTKVLHSLSESWVEQKDVIPCNHIAYAKWADIAIVAPVSANTLAKMAWGVSDNLVLTTLLACEAPKLLAPAMNTAMLESVQIQECLSKLKGYGLSVVAPRVGMLACDTYGKGAMSEVGEIVFEACKLMNKNPFWKDKQVIITGGGSREKIDCVRYISNHSSGLQASNLAIALFMLGAKVSLIASSFPIALPLGIECVGVSDGASYLEAIEQRIPSEGRAFLFMAAAIGDYIPAETFDGKLKKDTLGETWNILCQKNIDILKTLTSPNLFKIGFKAESDVLSAEIAAKKMLQAPQDGGKGCGVVCLNIIGENNPFGAQENEMVLFSHDTTHKTGRKNKLAIGFEIAGFVQKLLC